MGDVPSMRSLRCGIKQVHMIPGWNFYTDCMEFTPDHPSSPTPTLHKLSPYYVAGYRSLQLDDNYMFCTWPCAHMHRAGPSWKNIWLQRFPSPCTLCCLYLQAAPLVKWNQNSYGPATQGHSSEGARAGSHYQTLLPVRSLEVQRSI